MSHKKPERLAGRNRGGSGAEQLQVRLRCALAFPSTVDAPHCASLRRLGLRARVSVEGDAGLWSGIDACQVVIGYLRLAGRAAFAPFFFGLPVQVVAIRARATACIRAIGARIAGRVDEQYLVAARRTHTTATACGAIAASAAIARAASVGASAVATAVALAVAAVAAATIAI